MGIGILLNLAITIFIIGMWVSFIRNLVRETRKNNDKRMTGTTRTASSQGREQMPAQTRQRPVIERVPANQPSRNTRADLNVQELLQNPRTLYLELKQRLPKQYEQEIQDIFNSPNPNVRLINFIRRKEIWPIAQSILRDGISSKDQSSRNRQRPSSAPRNVAPALVSELSDGTDYVEEMQEATDRIIREQEELVREYDGFGSDFDHVFEESSLLDDSDYIQTESRSATRQDEQRHKERQEWLKEAVKASIILERPEY